jgi:hypothetical protein
MSEPERYLLFALSLLVTRQRALLRGEAVPYFFRALRVPVLFKFVHSRGAFRCVLEGPARELFSSSVLVVESLDFVSPLSALGPHVKLVQTSESAPVEVKLSAQFGDWLGLSADDGPYAVYSPLQVLFSSQIGFFLPHREPWHAYVGRCVAARTPGAHYAAQGEQTRVSWPEGGFEAAERSGAAFLAYESPALRFSLQVDDSGFDLSASARAATSLLAALRKVCLSGAMPEGIRAAEEGPSAVRIRGGTA